MVAGTEGKPSRLLSCPNEASRVLLDSVRLMERSGLKGNCLDLEMEVWLQMLDDQSELPLSSLLMCSELKLWLGAAGGEGGEKKEADRFRRLLC